MNLSEGLRLRQAQILLIISDVRCLTQPRAHLVLSRGASSFAIVNPEMNDTKSTGETQMDSPTVHSELQIHFVKSTAFRVVHASGVWYGGDAQQNLHLTFYNERFPIPKRIVLNLDQRGTILGEDISQHEGKVGIVREMEVDVILSLPFAVQLYQTLGENLKAMGAIEKIDKK